MLIELKKLFISICKFFYETPSSDVKVQPPKKSQRTATTYNNIYNRLSNYVAESAKTESSEDPISESEIE